MRFKSDVVLVALPSADKADWFPSAADVRFSWGQTGPPRNGETTHIRGRKGWAAGPCEMMQEKTGVISGRGQLRPKGSSEITSMPQVQKSDCL